MVSHQIKVSQNFVCCSDQSKIPTLSTSSLSKYSTANSCKLNHQELAQITFSWYIFHYSDFFASLCNSICLFQQLVEIRRLWNVGDVAQLMSCQAASKMQAGAAFPRLLHSWGSCTRIWPRGPLPTLLPMIMCVLKTCSCMHKPAPYWHIIV